MDRSLLEFHLDTLTSRSQETEFARFVHRLCELEVCPNLLPQTGPTGGGDSKVDAETYPVADGLSIGWYEGVGRQAAEERWAFAFSAKKDWSPKFRSDIAKVVETNRGYAKAFFVTNQSIPDKKRAAEEDALTKKYGIDVRIFDRTWILNKVFNGHHEGLAVDLLNVTAIPRQRVYKGPLDTKRERELELLEKQIQEALSEGDVGPHLAGKALEAASLARSLERPRMEVSGRYQRAKELARRHGTSRQQAEAFYQEAWTSYWWFEDAVALAEQYRDLEKLVCGSSNPYDLEELANLWQLSWTAFRKGALNAEQAKLEERAKTLTEALTRLCIDEARPSAALQAEATRCHVELMRQGDPTLAGDYLRSLKNIVLKSKGLVGFPLKPLIDLIKELDATLGDVDAYSDLFETVLETVSEREGEVRGARLLLSRGENQLVKKRPVDAIATLGRALARLHKHESRHELVRALYICGYAYDEIGLPWAARGTVLHAANIATVDLFQYGKVTSILAACFRSLKWLELELGRIPHTLAWYEVDRAAHRFSGQKNDAEEEAQEDSSFQLLLGRLFLRSNRTELRAIGTLPTTLDGLGLTMAADALLFVLGYEERAQRACQQALGKDIQEFACSWANVEAPWHLADSADFYSQPTVDLRSQVLGCQVIVECINTSPCTEVGESFLAALEGFLATGALSKAIAFETELRVCIRVDENAKHFVESKVEERAGRPVLEVICQPFNPHTLDSGHVTAVRAAVFEAAICALSYTIRFKGGELTIEELFKNERVTERASMFTASFGTLANVLGPKPKTHLASWLKQGMSDFPLIREVLWQVPEPVKSAKPPPGPQDGEIDDSVLDMSQTSHADMKAASVIRLSLWDKAGWVGAAFETPIPLGAVPPILSLVFQQIDVGAQIFSQWREEFGEENQDSHLRIVAVRGIDSHNPAAYRLVVGTNPYAVQGARVFSFISRAHRVDPKTTENLDRFIASLVLKQGFYLAPAQLTYAPDGSPVMTPLHHLKIKIKDFFVRDARDIGPNDIDRCGILDEDEIANR